MKLESKPRRPRREPRHRGKPLLLDPAFSFPVGQTVALGTRPIESAIRLVHDVLQEDWFRVIPRPTGSVARTVRGSPTEVIPCQVAERNVRTGPTNPPVLHAMLALLGGGVALAVIEALIGVTLLYAAPWVAITGGGALLLWIRFGRTYESDVIVATVQLTSGAGGQSSPAAGQAGRSEVKLEAGKVLSMVHSGQRLAIQVVDCPPPLTRELVSIVRKLEGLVNNGRPSPVPAPSHPSG